MDLAELTAKAAAAIPGSDFKKKVKFDFGDDGILYIDGESGTVDNSNGTADATILVTWDDFLKMRAGELDGTMAFMQGKLKVEGDMSVAMQLQSVMGSLRD